MQYAKVENVKSYMKKKYCYVIPHWGMMYSDIAALLSV